MAEAPDHTWDSAVPPARSSMIQVPQTVEEAAEEEDVFLHEIMSPCPLLKARDCSGNGSGGVARSDSDIEREFLHLAIRKQVSYRKAIAKSGLQHLSATPSAATLGRLDPDREVSSCVDWTEGALYGEHIWFETSVSGDFCYVGEQHCIAKTLQKSVARKKCAACKIVVHMICIQQLEKLSNQETPSPSHDDSRPVKDTDFINFRCKPSFRESGSRNLREVSKSSIVRHHWVHRRRQDGKCRQCGKGFQQKFAFHSKEIVAISCSWCKQAYHNKVSCFMLQQIEEACSLGAHAAVIVPPTWIIHVRRPQTSLKSSKKKKRTSFKRKSSKKGAEVRCDPGSDPGAAECWRAEGQAGC